MLRSEISFQGLSSYLESPRNSSSKMNRNLFSTKIILIGILFLQTSSCAKIKSSRNLSPQNAEKVNVVKLLKDDFNSEELEEVSEATDSPINDNFIEENGSKDFQCMEETLYQGDQNSGDMGSDAEICKKVSLQCIHDSLQKLIEDPSNQVSGKDYACILINLMQRNSEYSRAISTLESRLKDTRNELQELTTSVDSHNQKFVPLEKLAELETRYTEKSTKSLGETSESFKALNKKINELEKRQEFDENKKSEESFKITRLAEENKGEMVQLRQFFNTTIDFIQNQTDSFGAALWDLNKIGEMWSNVASSVEEIGARCSQVELEIVGKVKEIETKTNRLYSEIANQTSEVRDTLEKEWSQNFQQLLDSNKRSQSTLTKEFADFKSYVERGLENATNDMKELIQSPFQLIDILATDLNSKIKTETERAVKIESTLSYFIVNQTSITNNLKSNLDAEVSKTTNLQKVFTELKTRFGKFTEEFRIQLNLESLRTKGTEAQISTIITNEVERAKKQEKEINEKVEILGKNLIEESKRAVLVEAGLLANINEELKRSSEAESQLNEATLNNMAKIGEIHEHIGSLKTDFENDIKERDEIIQLLVRDHKTKLENVQSSFKLKISEAKTEAELLNKKIENAVLEMEEKSNATSSNILKVIEDRTAKFEDSILANINMSGKLAYELVELRSIHNQNFTAVVNKVESLENSLEAELEQVSEKGKESEKKFSSVLLNFASDMENKMESTNENVTKRFEKLEADVKGLKEPTKPQQGVFNSIIGYFRRPQYNRTNKSSPKKDPAKTPHPLKVNQTKDSVTSRLRVENVFEKEADDEESELMAELTETGKSSSGRSIPIVVQRSNSKVSNIYG